MVGAIESMRDITDRKQAEKALQERERELFTLISNLPGMVYNCLNDRNWTMMFVSDGALALTGYSPDELIESKVVAYNNLVHPDDRQSVYDAVQGGIEKKSAYTMEYRIISKTASVKYVWERGQGVFAPDGKLYRLEGFVSDITDRKQAEHALRESHENLERRVEERTQELSAVNEELRAVNEEMVAMNEDLVHTNERLQTLQGHLVQSEKMAALGSLVAGVAHEINTPIGVGVTAASHLNNISEQFREDYAKTAPEQRVLDGYMEDIHEATAIILKNLERASRLIRSFKQVSVDQSSESRRNFAVREYLDEILLSLNPQLRKTNHTIDVECDPALKISSYPRCFGPDYHQSAHEFAETCLWSGRCRPNPDRCLQKE